MNSLENMLKAVGVLAAMRAPKVQYVFDTEDNLKKKLAWVDDLGSSGIYGCLLADVEACCLKLDFAGFTFYFVDVDQLPK